jgi:hypothetical protein
MKPTHPSDALRAQLLEHCEEVINRAQLMRNYAMKPGNAWLARGELGSLQATLYEIDILLDEIKQSDKVA